MPTKTRHNAGFTLAELLVATTLTVLVMGGVYVAFSSSIRLWRLGEANLRTYQDARTSMSIMTRELQSMLPGAMHLFEGTDDEFEFFAISPPMDVEDRDGPRVMWIKYRLKADPNQRGKILLREERLVEGPLPLRSDEDNEFERTRLKLARKQSFELAAGVVDFELRYYWRPIPERGEGPGAPPGDPAIPDEGEIQELEPVEFVVKEEHGKGDGFPQGIHIAMTLDDPGAESGKTTFETMLTFRGLTTPLREPEEGEEAQL
ncbi:MAG: hypothetical protein GY851_28065 [bacterium]|nr:hypothetical protein [bacterium]